MTSAKINNKFFPRFFACTVLSGLTPFTHAIAAEKSAAATTTWQISRVASMSQGSYCTMTQKFSDETILTFARNARSEYSLAIERPDAKFDVGKDQSVTLRPAEGSSQTFKAKNDSSKATIVGLGRNAPLLDQLAKSQKISIDIAKSPTTYTFANYEQGQSELDKCIAALTASKDSTADLVKPVVTGAASADAQLSKKTTRIEATSEAVAQAEEYSSDILPSVEGLLAAKPTPSSGAEALGSSEAVPIKTVVKEQVADLVPPVIEEKTEPVSVSTESVQTNIQSAHSDVAALRDENARLKKSLNETRKTFEDKQAANNGPVIEELKSKLDMANSEKKILEEQIAELQAKKNTLNNPTTEPAADVSLLQSEISSLTAENSRLQQQIKLAESKQASNQPSEGKSLGDDDKLRAELRDARAQLAALQISKSGLESTIEKLQKEGENSQLKVAGGNWDLEQATRRYQESQREIRRLGALLDEKTQQCQKEKKDIEYMLFDPEIAKKAQISMLNSLEDKIVEKDRAIKDLEAKASKPSPEQEKQLAELKQQLAVLQQQSVANAASATKVVDDAKAQLAEKEKSLVALQSEITQKTNDLKDAQNKLAAAQTDVAAKQAVDAQKAAEAQASLDAQKTLLTSLTDQVAKSTQKITELESQLSLAQAKIASQEKTLAEASEAAKLAKVASAAGTESAAIQQPISAQQQAPHQGQPIQEASLSSQAQPATPRSIASNQPSPFMTADAFRNILNESGVSVSSGMKEIAGGDPSAYKAYSWRSNNLYGSVEMQKIGNSASLDDVAQKYMARAKSRCGGDFAAVPSIIPGGGKGYEIACVTPTSNSSASVLFTYSNGIATTVAHEGKSDVMDVAIETRDKIASRLTR